MTLSSAPKYTRLSSTAMCPVATDRMGNVHLVSPLRPSRQYNTLSPAPTYASPLWAARAVTPPGTNFSQAMAPDASVRASTRPSSAPTSTRSPSIAGDRWTPPAAWRHTISPFVLRMAMTSASVTAITRPAPVSKGATVLMRGAVHAFPPSTPRSASTASPAETNTRPASAAIGTVTSFAMRHSSWPSVTERAMRCADFSATKTRSPSLTGGALASAPRSTDQNAASGSLGGSGLSAPAERVATHASRTPQSANALQDMVVRPVGTPYNSVTSI